MSRIKRLKTQRCSLFRLLCKRRALPQQPHGQNQKARNAAVFLFWATLQRRALTSATKCPESKSQQRIGVSCLGSFAKKSPTTATTFPESKSPKSSGVSCFSYHVKRSPTTAIKSRLQRRGKPGKQFQLRVNVLLIRGSKRWRTTPKSVRPDTRCSTSAVQSSRRSSASKASGSSPGSNLSLQQSSTAV
jgi:hypothetical protein